MNRRSPDDVETKPVPVVESDARPEQRAAWTHGQAGGDAPRVVAVGLPAGLSGVVTELRGHGLMVAEAESAADLPRLLRRYRRVALIVYEPKGSDAVEGVFLRVSECFRRIPVVVVAESSEFGEYYQLMSSGAVGYYGLSESPRRIARAVELAAERQAS